MSVEVSYRTLVDGELEERWEPVTAEVVDRLLEQRLAEYGATIQDQPTPGAPLSSEIIFGMRTGQDRGAIYYTDEGGAWFSRGAPARDGDTEVYYADLDFPADSEIALAQLRQALLEYHRTARRPTCIDWQPA
ncbi:Imm1 family immunity protein [Allokutzneria sp. A3M-2-11 16]|uniref:Imm1 family immunity protein n=1 Tax=Allokutzneria sp. A3M-2-11 16 TaxID=2962043 RepID=UPI0020B7AAED|nr:Imm1 family immunity protein [Allokutzneria sp. A3M-2-11 16]MCP3801156.1 Imm1 family immunity protein [Allokutzneria sp. A3M-2-11 16]